MALSRPLPLPTMSPLGFDFDDIPLFNLDEFLDTDPLDIELDLHGWGTVLHVREPFVKKAFVSTGPDFLDPWGDYRLHLMAICRSLGATAFDTTNKFFLAKIHTGTREPAQLGEQFAISSWRALKAFREFDKLQTPETVDWAVCVLYGATHILFYGLTAGDWHFPLLINTGLGFDTHFDSDLVVDFFNGVDR